MTRGLLERQLALSGLGRQRDGVDLDDLEASFMQAWRCLRHRNRSSSRLRPQSRRSGRRISPSCASPQEPARWPQFARLGEPQTPRRPSHRTAQCGSACLTTECEATPGLPWTGDRGYHTNSPYQSACPFCGLCPACPPERRAVALPTNKPPQGSRCAGPLHKLSANGLYVRDIHVPHQLATLVPVSPSRQAFGVGRWRS
jgi:hypothetical protein